jgi:plastocyanin
MRKLILAGVLFLALTLILSACSGTATTPTSTPAATPTPIATSTPTSTPITGQASVNISNFAYVPPTLTVSVGTTVTWTNNDSVAHTVTSNDNLFDSGNLATGATFSYTFEQKGTFNYHCTIHPFMTGKIIVE